MRTPIAQEMDTFQVKKSSKKKKDPCKFKVELPQPTFLFFHVLHTKLYATRKREEPM